MPHMAQVMLAAYTAQLTTFLIQPTFELHGPTHPSELGAELACFGNIALSEMVRGFHQNHIIWPPMTEQLQGSVAAVQWCVDALMKGEVGYVGMAYPELQLYLASKRGSLVRSWVTRAVGRSSCRRSWLGWGRCRPVEHRAPLPSCHASFVYPRILHPHPHS